MCSASANNSKKFIIFESKTFSKLSKNNNTLLFSKYFIKFLIGSSSIFSISTFLKNFSEVLISFCNSTTSPLENVSVLKEWYKNTSNVSSLS